MHEIQSIMKQVAMSLNYIHKRGLVHSNLLPSNILIKNGTVVLCDFCLPRFFRPGSLQSDRDPEKMGYISPESLKGAKTSMKSDVYSFGAILSELLQRKKPPKECVHPIDIESCPKELEAIVLRSLSSNEEERPSISEIISILSFE